MNYIEKLEQLLNNSYAPYSNYQVAAIAVMKDGQEFGGVNVENAAYGSTICAERSAIVSAISNGYKKGDFKSLYIMTKEKNGTPCGACRQVMEELFNKDTNIFIAKQDNTFDEYKMNELLPYPFSEEEIS